MGRCRLILPVFSASLLLVGSSRLAAAEGELPADPAQLKAALVGTWSLDVEATADAMAMAHFGRQVRLVPNPKKPGQPRTWRTNITNKPFNMQEYAMLKSAALGGFEEAKAKHPNLKLPQIIFAPDGTGMFHNPNLPRGEDGSRFRWMLLGRQLTLTALAKTNSLQTEFTNRNQLTLRRTDPEPGIRETPKVYKPERPTSKSLTNAPPQ